MIGGLRTDGLISLGILTPSGYVLATGLKRVKNRVKTQKEILKVRVLQKSGLSIRAIAKRLGFSKNTVKKIVYGEAGYEGEEFRHSRWKGKAYSSPIYVSEIDGENIHCQSMTTPGYPRISKNKKRTWLHIYESKKAFEVLKKKWPKTATVHHKDYNVKSCCPDNLIVFEDAGAHRRYHGEIEKAMYLFLEKMGLLGSFFDNNPCLKIKSIGDMLNEPKKT